MKRISLLAAFLLLVSLCFPYCPMRAQQTGNCCGCCAEAGGPSAASQGLKVRFLGTGAADWNGVDGRGEQRRLTSILVEDSLLIDLTPSDMEMIPEGCRPKAVFYTHSHGDHFNPDAALAAGVSRVYLSATWLERGRSLFKAAAERAGAEMPEIIPLDLYSTVCEGGVTLTALPANHGTGHFDEQALIYLLQKDSVRVLYATDTGGLPANAVQFIGIDIHRREANPIHGLIMECTVAADEEDYRLFTHSSIATVLHTVNVLSQTKRYLPAAGQHVWLTHLARTLHGTQAELDASLPSPLRAAHDGLEVVFTLP